MKFSNQIVWAVVILNVIFTAAVLFVFLKTGNEPSVLVGCWFGFTGTELVALAGIKIKKIKHGAGEINDNAGYGSNNNQSL